VRNVGRELGLPEEIVGATHSRARVSRFAC
jgi:hypothetical protein